MNDGLTLSPNLARMAEVSDVHVRRRDAGLDVSDGEVGLVISPDDRGYVASRWERADEPFPVMHASRTIDVERYLVLFLGSDVRRRLRLDRISLPWRSGEIASGFEVTDLGGWWLALTPSQVTPGEEAPVIELKHDDPVRFSHIAKVDVDLLVASYFDPDGAPALQEFVRRP